MSKKVLPDQLMNSVLGYLYDTLCTGDDVAPQSKDNYLSWCTPGIPMTEDDFTYMSEGLMGVTKSKPSGSNGSSGDEEEEGEGEGMSLNQRLSADVAQKYQAAENFSRICDMIPDTSGVKGSTTMNVWNVENTLTDAYEHVLNQSQVADFGIDEKTKKKLERLRGLLQEKKTKKDIMTDEEVSYMGKSALVEKYNEKRKAYSDAALEYNTHRVNALSGQDPSAVHFWSMNAPILRNKVQFAMDDWVTNGYKNEYEQIAAFIEQIESRSMALLKAKYKEEFEMSHLTGMSSGMDFMYTTLAPGSFVKSSGWTKFEFNKSTYESGYSYDNKKATGSANYGFGLWNASAKGGYEKKEKNVEIDSSNFKLTFKIAQVPIIRPGININFLTSNYWRFHPDNLEFKDDMVSDGKQPPSGMIPAIPTTCIFIRDLMLDFGERHYMVDTVKEAKSGSGSVGWGPFSIGGSYKHESFERDSESSAEGQSIEVPGIQLMGFKCHMMPKSPNPHPDIKDSDWV